MKTQQFYLVSNNGVIWCAALLPAVALAMAIVKHFEVYNNRNDLKRRLSA